MNKYFPGVIVALALWSMSLTTAHADYTIDVSVNTSGLTGDPNLNPPNESGSFGIDFEMFSGGYASSNTVTISNFNFGGGSLSGSSDSLGGTVSGDLSSTVTLTVNPSNSFSDFNQGFTPGSTLSFQVNMTANLGATADSFGFYIESNYSPFDQSNFFTNNNSTPLPSNSPTGALSIFQITPNSPTVSVYDSTDQGDPYSPQASVVPEPSTLLLSAISLALLGLAAGWRRLRRVRIGTA